MSADATSYVERAADKELLEALLAGRFCYVLNSRQMGKSSLCVRTIKRLEAESVRTAFVDLTKIGGKNVTPDQWYAGIGVEIGRSLGMRTEILDYWKENSHLSAVQRLFGALREVVLERIGSRVAVFFDEIDATRSLPFKIGPKIGRDELCGKVGDGANQAADLISATASIPSLNFIPLTTFGNWF